MRRRFVFIVPLVLLALGRSAAAAPSAADQQAEAAFQQARALMGEGRHAEACPLLDASYRLAPGLGTLINLGGCYEHTGKLALAHRTFLKAEAQARSSGRPEREREAAALARALEPKIGRLRIVAPSTDDVVVTVDAEELERRAHLGPIAVEPGTHRVQVKSASGTFTREVNVAAGAEVRVGQEEAHEAGASHAEPVPADGGPSGLRIGGYVALGIGVVATAVGSIVLIGASSKYSESDDHCTARGCDSKGLDLVSSARSSGNVATALFIVGGVGLGTGIGLLVLAPSKSTSGASVRVTPSATGLLVSGAF